MSQRLFCYRKEESLHCVKMLCTVEGAHGCCSNITVAPCWNKSHPPLADVTVERNGLIACKSKAVNGQNGNACMQLLMERVYSLKTKQKSSSNPCRKKQVSDTDVEWSQAVVSIFIQSHLIQAAQYCHPPLLCAHGIALLTATGSAAMSLWCFGHPRDPFQHTAINKAKWRPGKAPMV